MNNAYQQKLQERARLLMKAFYNDADLDIQNQHWVNSTIKRTYIPLAILTLEWSANELLEWCQYVEGFSKEYMTLYLQKNGFIPPKTDNNE